ncbi:tetratricopeptide repeat protein [Streptomyces albidoflavus]
MELPDPLRLRTEFAEEARSERPGLARLCLLVGAVADPARGEPGIDAAEVELDRLAGELPHRPATPRDWALALAELLGTRYGFHGTESDYRRLGSSLLQEVLRRRRGLPILLSVVWLEVARRAGAPVHGVALPGHFTVGFGPPDDLVLADPFDGGTLLSPADASLLVTGVTGAPLDPSLLRPADPLEVIRRVLNNIRAWAAARPERTDVALWAVELSLLLPSHPADLRYEHAQLLVKCGDFVRGARELESYAEVVAAVDPEAAELVRGQARAARARLN